MKVIVDTGPLLFLSKIDRLSILEKFGQMLVPTGVISEIKHKQDEALTAVVKATKDWLSIGAVKDKNLFKVLSKELDEGESEVICLALEQKAKWVILDDHDARRFAHRYGLNFSQGCIPRPLGAFTFFVKDFDTPMLAAG